MSNLLKLSIFEAFIGHICEDVRAIAFDVHDSTILIYVYLERIQNDEDYEIVDMAVTEILASNPQFLKQEIVFQETTQPFNTLNSYRGWIFRKYEQ